MLHNPWDDLQLILCDNDLIKSTQKTPETLIGVFWVSEGNLKHECSNAGSCGQLDRNDSTA